MHNVHIKTMFGQDTLHIVPDAREGEGEGRGVGGGGGGGGGGW